MDESSADVTTVWDTYRYCVHEMLRFANVWKFEKWRSHLCLGGFTQNPVTAYDPAYGQRQSSHMQQE